MNAASAPATAISLSVAPDSRRACAAIAGDIDIASEPQLSTLTSLLTAAGCATIYLDLGEVTFAGATMLRFLTTLRHVLPADTTVHLCRPSSLLIELLTIVQLDTAVFVQPALPDTWTIPQSLQPPGEVEDLSGASTYLPLATPNRHLLMGSYVPGNPAAVAH